MVGPKLLVVLLASLNPVLTMRTDAPITAGEIAAVDAPADFQFAWFLTEETGQSHEIVWHACLPVRVTTSFSSEVPILGPCIVREIDYLSLIFARTEGWPVLHLIHVKQTQFHVTP